MTLTQIRLRLARCDLRKLVAETGVSERTLRRIREICQQSPDAYSAVQAVLVTKATYSR